MDKPIHKLVICANMFVRKDGKYLMMKRKNDAVVLGGVVHPWGGTMELGENPLECARRELFEETGLKVKNVRLEAVFMERAPHLHHDPDHPYNWLIFHFSGDYDSGEIKPNHEGSVVLLEAQDITKQTLGQSVRFALEHIINPEQGTVFATFFYDKDGKLIDQKADIDFCVK